MRIIAFLLDDDAINALLRYLCSKGRDSRALPEYDDAAAGRDPP